jgi:hypothetical protein
MVVVTTMATPPLLLCSTRRAGDADVPAERGRELRA